MKQIDRDTLDALLAAAGVRARLRRELRFTSETITDWDEREYIAISDRTGNKGVLVIELESGRYVTPYTLTGRLVNKQTGRSKPVICDLCYTWQASGKGAQISFTRSADGHGITLLSCADLDCSRHVRSKTAAAVLSRANLREDLTDAQRVDRLHKKLAAVVERLQLVPVDLD